MRARRAMKRPARGLTTATAMACATRSTSRIDVEDDDLFGQSRDQLCNGLMGRMRQVVVASRTAREADDERPLVSALQAFRARTRPAMNGQNTRDRVREGACQLGKLAQLRATGFRLPADENNVHDGWNRHRYRVPYPIPLGAADQPSRRQSADSAGSRARSTPKPSAELLSTDPQDSGRARPEGKQPPGVHG